MGASLVIVTSWGWLSSRPAVVTRMRRALLRGRRASTRRRSPCRSGGRRRVGRRRRRAGRRTAPGPRCPRARACCCPRRRRSHRASTTGRWRSGRRCRRSSRPSSPCRGTPCSGGPRTAPSRRAPPRCRRAASRASPSTAPATIALTMSPENVMPPSAMIGMSSSAPVCDANQTADSCGMPAPRHDAGRADRTGATPTLTASAPARASASTPSSVTTLPAVTGRSGHDALDPLDRLHDVGRVAVGGVDRDGVDTHRDQRLDPLLDVVADADRGGAAQPALRCRGRRSGSRGASGCPSP